MNRADEALRRLYVGTELFESVLSAPSEPLELERAAARAGPAPAEPPAGLSSGADDAGEPAPRVKVMSAEDVMAIALGQVDAPVGGGALSVTAAPEKGPLTEPEPEPAPAPVSAPTDDIFPDEPTESLGAEALEPEARIDTDFTEAVTKEERPAPAPTERLAPAPPAAVSESERSELLEEPTTVRAPAQAVPQPAGLVEPALAIERFASAAIAASGAEADRLARAICAHRFEYGPSVVFTSTGTCEGKTALATAVALAAARSGVSTVLVDACLGSANASRMIGPEPTAGLLDVLEGTVDLGAVLVRSEAEGLCMVPSAGGIRSEGSALSGEAAAGVVSRLHHLFELTVIDAPAVSEEPAVAGLAAMAGGVVLAVKARSTERRELERSVEELESAGAKIMGLVLTYLPGSEKTAVGAAALP